MPIYQTYFIEIAISSGLVVKFFNSVTMTFYLGLRLMFNRLGLVDAQEGQRYFH